MPTRTVRSAAHVIGPQIKRVAEPMTPENLGKRAQRLAKSKSRAESAKLTAEITDGFFAGTR